MNKQKKIFISIIIFLTLLLAGCQVFAVNNLQEEIELSANYLEYLALGDEEKEKVIVPKMYDIEKTKREITNPFKIVGMLGSSINNKYSLKTLIPQNVVVKNQGGTNTCWAFSSLASLESHLGLKDYKNGITPIIYDLSERHMDYATSELFLNNETNKWGYKRVAGSTGVAEIPIAYLTNGLGAIYEKDMEFQNNSGLIDISEIQNKKVITQVNDIIIFPSYTSTEDLAQIKQQMKEHIMNHGAIIASVNGFGFGAYNDETAAAYVNDRTIYVINHSVAIVGWDDTYSKENFLENHQPQNDGAWIIKNSYGSEFGDEGFVYISYEDANIYKELTGIQDAQTEITYENIYQYDEFGGYLKYKLSKLSSPKIYFATEFDKKTTGKEYLTQVSITASETYKCKVYVNPNGTSKSINDLQQVQLKSGDTETFEAGYHTIEFLEPLKINSESFVVVLEIVGTQTDSITTLVEVNYGEFYTDPKYDYAANHVFDNVTIADSKCFLAKEEGFLENQWEDVSKKYETSGGKVPNFDTTIKAFTTSKVLESISVETLPTKTTYIEGQNFDSTGMVIKANYANGDSIEITDYKIQNVENLQQGQTNVTIVYEGKTVEQTIEVVPNTLEKIEIIIAPTKNEYWAGDNFDRSGMVLQGVYLDGTTELITDYTVQDGENLKNGQSTVTIKYQELTTTQEITVLANLVKKLEIKQGPNKVNYVAKQNFDKTGMIVEAIYGNGTIKRVTDFTVRDGNDLYEGQTTITIVYEEQTATQAINVVAKTVTGIKVKTIPTKIEYMQNKEELDLNGGIIEISYNDNTTEEMLMKSKEITVEGFNNQQVGKQNIVVKYQGFTTSFDITIKEQPKPENSNFNDIKIKLNEMKAFYFTDESKKDYVTIKAELENIIKSEVNDSVEYYYYISPSPNEVNIEDWVKIELQQYSENNFGFEINSLDFSNYEELANAQNAYLYIKEIATRNGMSVEKIISALELVIENINIEEFIDGVKKADINSDTIIDSTQGGEPDDTTAKVEIPNAGKNILIIFFVFVIISVVIIYIRYKDIEIK